MTVDKEKRSGNVNEHDKVGSVNRSRRRRKKEK